MFYDKVSESALYIKEKIDRIPELCVILGSGLGSLVDLLEDKVVLPYSEIPNFPVSTVEGHAGEFIFGHIGGVDLVFMSGRFHYYEGFTMKEVTFPVYVMKLLGVKTLVVTNACGGLNTSFTPGDLMIITDHINIWGENPLIGSNDERFGPRFPDMTEVYSKELIARADAAAEKLGIACQKGVYALFSGPCYETAAEIRAYAALGADAIGMSTVPEATAANYMGIKVMGVACITNMATGIAKTKHSHAEVLRIANESSAKLCRLLEEFIRGFNKENV